MRTLLLTDLHLYEKPPGYLDAQVYTIIKILEEHKGVDDCVILGDVFMRRKPSPSELLAFQHICWRLNALKIPTTILRGNHDSEDKSDNGVTVLSLYESDYILVAKHIKYHGRDGRERVFIPHYEDESRIIDELENAPANAVIFGHFGYNGCMNSIGDIDFGIDLKYFKNQTYLGHIHKFKKEDNVTILGTPWTTNFGEAGDWKGYHILEGDKLYSHTTKHGPMHIVMTLEEVQDSVEHLNHLHENYFTLLRVLLDQGEGMKDMPDDLEVSHLDFKYKPSFDDDRQSSWKPQAELFQINSQIIEDYVNGCVTSLDSSSIMEGYGIIKGGEELPDED